MLVSGRRAVCSRTAFAAWLGGLLLLGCTSTNFDWQGRPTTALDAYQRSFEAAVGDRCVATMRTAELPDRAARAKVVWLGDHHRDILVHERHLELLRSLHRSGIPIALGLEALAEEDSLALADFLAHRTSLEQFTKLVRTRWPESWLDGGDVDCTHYRRLLLFAASSNTPVFALEPAPRLPLGQRDERIAANVRAAATRYPDRCIVVVIGQAHLLGIGDLIGRTGLPSLAMGAAPPPTLRLPSSPGPIEDLLWCSRGGMWFYADAEQHQEHQRHR